MFTCTRLICLASGAARSPRDGSLASREKKWRCRLRALPGLLVVSYFLSELAGFSLQKHGICHVESEPAVIAWLASKGLF
jgi:hypothetical protein